ncbi:MAG TPA: MarR family transcriptional regulator [Candidatus Acidoferrales bacterium]|nr:MarR family transcriptional regulator [Candidatus Acidoferrales bacterium]
MPRTVNLAGYRALAEFRYHIRLFFNATDDAVRTAGLEPEQYQLLLALRGMPQGETATIRQLAQRLQVRHNTAVERIDRLERMRLVRRAHSAADRREVLIDLTPRGDAIFKKLAELRLRELRRSGPALVRALGNVVEAARRIGGRSSSYRRRKGG